MNRTLFDCGVRKSVELKDGRLYDITSTLEKKVKLSSATVKCQHCGRTFKGQQYLDSHVQFKHPPFSSAAKNLTSNNSASSTSFESINNNSSSATSIQLENVPHGHEGQADVAQDLTPSQGNNRKGSKKRKSYTVEFKKKTLDLLDSLKTSTNKYNIVAKHQGTNRSLVVKWEKIRSKLMTELSLNTLKKNTGGTRPMRLRRRIAENRSQRTGKYPLASNQLVAYFKL